MEVNAINCRSISFSISTGFNMLSFRASCGATNGSIGWGIVPPLGLKLKAGCNSLRARFWTYRLQLRRQKARDRHADGVSCEGRLFLEICQLQAGEREG